MKLPKFFIVFFILTLILGLSSYYVNHPTNIYADEDEQLEEIEEEINETRDKIGELKEKINSIEGELDNLSGSLQSTLATINQVQDELNLLQQDINNVTVKLNQRSVNLTERTVVRDRTLRNFYKKAPSTVFASLVTSNQVLSEGNASSSHYLRKFVTDSVDRIESINSDIYSYKQNKKQLEVIKKDVEKERDRLIAIKADLEQKIAEREERLASSNQNLSSLNEKLSSLKQKQRQIIAAKEGNFYASLSSGSFTFDKNASPSYDPGFSPAFGAFSYGAYTHYNGMSQDGARGRAREGQSYEEIIEFYYNEGVEDRGDDFPDNVCVQGIGEMSFQKYLYGVEGEMPDSWDMDALKAQVIAARSYAYRYAKKGACICTSTQCQVFSESSANNPSANPRWSEAVDETENQVIGGSTDAPGYGWYSKSTGGYINNVGWDVAGGWENWPDGSYELKGESPWFLKGWYTETTDKNSNKCGRDHPWLNSEEMADILNAYELVEAGEAGDGVVPETINQCSIEGMNGDPYSKEELRDRAEEYGGGYSEVTSVNSVNFGRSSGMTNYIEFETDKGVVEIEDPQVLKSAFNLRAPGYISIKSRLFDIHQK